MQGAWGFGSLGHLRQSAAHPTRGLGADGYRVEAGKVLSLLYIYFPLTLEVIRVGRHAHQHHPPGASRRPG